MYERLTETFADARHRLRDHLRQRRSPDDSEEVIREISERDRRVLGITHSRNFGSQAAFRSGMEIATKNAVVLLDGDLQDPPELIAQFVEQWKAGYDVVYGRRVKREATLFMQRAYNAFYRVFDRFSYLSIPRDAGDFSLMDRRVVQAMLQCPERDLFLRGVRAFVGFRQTGVDYVRPKRMFGVTTNSLRQQHRLGQEGHLLVQQRAADDAQLRRHGALPDQPRARRGAGRRAHHRPGQRAARRRHRGDPRAAASARSTCSRSGSWASTSHACSRRSSGGRCTCAAASCATARCAWSRPRWTRARRRCRDDRVPPRRSSRAPAPCAARPSGHELAAARIDAGALDEYAFASRKFPEYMHHRLVECTTCDAVYASPVPDLGGIDAAYDAAAFDSKEEATFASRTYAGLVRPLLPHLPRAGSALDIGTGEGSFLEELLDLGFDRVRGYEPSAAPLAAASERVRALIVHDVFDAHGAAGQRPLRPDHLLHDHRARPRPRAALPRRLGPARPGRRADDRVPRPPRAAQPDARRALADHGHRAPAAVLAGQRARPARAHGVRRRPRAPDHQPLSAALLAQARARPGRRQAGARRRCAPRAAALAGARRCRSATSPRSDSVSAERCARRGA